MLDYALFRLAGWMPAADMRLQFIQRDVVLRSTGAVLPTLHDAPVLGEHPQVDVQHPHVRVAVIVSLELRFQLRPAIIAHQEVDVARHVTLQRVVVVETMELQPKSELLIDRRTLRGQVVDAVGDDPEQIQDVEHAGAVKVGELRAEAGRLEPVLAGVAGLKDLRSHQLVLQITVDIVGVLRQHSREDAVQERQDLSIDDRHALGRCHVAVLCLPLVDRHNRFQDQVSDELANAHPLVLAAVIRQALACQEVVRTEVGFAASVSATTSNEAIAAHTTGAGA